MLKIKKKYIYVEPCPKCNSFQTGYIITMDSLEKANYYKFKSLLNGEYADVVISTNMNDLEHNKYCKTCNIRWYGDLEKRYYTKEQIDNEKQKRRITEEDIEKFDFAKQKLKMRKKLLKQKKKQEKKALKKAKKIKEKNIKIKVKTKQK